MNIAAGFIAYLLNDFRNGERVDLSLLSFSSVMKDVKKHIKT